MDDAVVEVQPGHAPVSIDCKMDDAGPDSPGAKPAAADDHDGRYERSFQGGSHIAAQEFVEGGSVDQAVERLMVDDVFAPLLPESISPLPAPSDGREYPLGTTVEDIPDEGEPLAATPRTPLSRTFASRSTLLQTPTLSSRVPMPVKKNDTASAQVPHETEYRDETAGRGGSVLASHNQSGSGIYHAPRPRRRPSALDYLVSVSPVATPRATLEAVYKRAGVGASHVSGFSNMSAPPVLDSLHEGVAHGRVVDPGPQLNWSSSYPGLGGAHSGPLYQRPQALSDIYGSPPMAHSHASLASVTMPQTAPSTVQPGYGAGKLPMSGYQLLAAKLVGGLGGPPITPMYRRFEALNHRLLLYMQADLVDLENELGTLDSKDSKDRGYGAVPASRRHERWANSALGQQRTEILGQIGYKLCQYNQVMTSFLKTHDMPAPSLTEIYGYKSYLTNSQIVAEEETRFLDLPEDLVSLVREELPVAEELVADVGEATAMALGLVDEVVMPPPSRKEPESEAGHSSASVKRRPRQSHDSAETSLSTSVSQLALAMFVAVFVPVVTFAIIPDFAGRMTVVALVGASVGTALTQSGLVRLLERGALDWILCVAAYGATMAAVAWILG